MFLARSKGCFLWYEVHVHYLGYNWVQPIKRVPMLVLEATPKIYSGILSDVLSDIYSGILRDEDEDEDDV